MAEAEGGEFEAPSRKTARMRRAPGGRHLMLGVRLTVGEDGEVRRRAAEQGLSPQRFLIEAGLSGSAAGAAERRRAAVDAMATRAVLKGAANNLNQLAKWANANHVLPDGVDLLFDDLARAVAATERATLGLEAAFDVTSERASSEVGS